MSLSGCANIRVALSGFHQGVLVRVYLYQGGLIRVSLSGWPCQVGLIRVSLSLWPYQGVLVTVALSGCAYIRVSSLQCSVYCTII